MFNQAPCNRLMPFYKVTGWRWLVFLHKLKMTSPKNGGFWMNFSNMPETRMSSG